MDSIDTLQTLNIRKLHRLFGISNFILNMDRGPLLEMYWKGDSAGMSHPDVSGGETVTYG